MTSRTRVTFVWNEITGYMAACLNELQRRSAISLSVISYPATQPFEVVVKNSKIVTSTNYSEFRDTVLESDPEVLVICGWGNSQMRMIGADSKTKSIVKVVAFDSPWTGTIRQYIGLLVLRRHMQRFKAAVIASDRGRFYAQLLGFSDSQIATGMYSVDYATFSHAAEIRPTPWPKQFAFVGRFALEKGIRHLVDAYRAYRSEVVDPWPLICYGSGPLKGLIDECQGIVDGGFIRPQLLPFRLANAGAFVLPSSYEPWGAVIAEAGAAGLPIICSTACGSSIDLVQHCFNGYKVAAGNVLQLKRAFKWMHHNYDHLALMGRRSSKLSEAYSAEAWADRWENLIQQLLLK